jgi:hypothetical protein
MDIDGTRRTEEFRRATGEVIVAALLFAAEPRLRLCSARPDALPSRAWARLPRELARRRKETQMHALVVRVTIHNVDRTREVLNSQVVPQVSGAPGFKTGYWTWSTGGGGSNGLSMIIFDSEENARAAGDRVGAIAADAPDDVTLDSVEVREVVASA